jgi:hypothetical protein
MFLPAEVPVSSRSKKVCFIKDINGGQSQILILLRKDWRKGMPADNAIDSANSSGLGALKRYNECLQRNGDSNNMAEARGEQNGGIYF